MWQIWQIFALLEGLLKTVGSLLQKWVGDEMQVLSMGCIAAVIIGATQTAGGFGGIISLSRKHPGRFSFLLAPNTHVVRWACIFGVSAGIFGTVLSIYTFTLGIQMGIRTLIMNSSIIFGAILGRFLWKDELGIRQVCGIGIFIVALWAMQNFDSPHELMASSGLALLVALVVTISNAFNEVFSRKMNDAGKIVCKEILGEKGARAALAYVKNFWAGIMTVISCSLALVIIIAFTNIPVVPVGLPFGIGTFLIGIVVIAMISFMQLSYQFGAGIAGKNGLGLGIYLITATIAGDLLLDEPITKWMTLGMFLFFPAYFLIDNKAWRELREFAKKKFSYGK